VEEPVREVATQEDDEVVALVAGGDEVDEVKSVVGVAELVFTQRELVEAVVGVTAIEVDVVGVGTTELEYVVAVLRTSDETKTEEVFSIGTTVDVETTGTDDWTTVEDSLTGGRV